MNHHRPPHCLPGRKSAGHKGGPGAAAVGQERRQVTLVARMLGAARVVVPAGSGEIHAAAVFSLVDMKAIKARAVLRKAPDLGGHQRPPGNGVEVHRSPQLWRIRAAPDAGIRIRLSRWNSHCNHPIPLYAADSFFAPELSKFGERK